MSRKLAAEMPRSPLSSPLVFGRKLRETPIGFAEQEYFPVKLVSVIASGWAALYAADQFIYDGRLLTALVRFARSIAAGFGFH